MIFPQGPVAYFSQFWAFACVFAKGLPFIQKGCALYLQNGFNISNARCALLSYMVKKTVRVNDGRSCIQRLPRIQHGDTP